MEPFIDGGSTGHGSEYRRRLTGTWGVVDVQDSISCVEYLRDEKMIDEKRVAITGGSAGGYTVLAALCDSKVFTAGCSYYGVSDLAALASDTHKVSFAASSRHIIAAANLSCRSLHSSNRNTSSTCLEEHLNKSRRTTLSVRLSTKLPKSPHLSSFSKVLRTRSFLKLKRL